MNQNGLEQSACKNVFQNGDTPDKEMITRKWLELIVLLEKGKIAE